MDSHLTPLNILIVEDNDDLRESIIDALTSLGHHVRGVDCAEAVPEQIDLVRLDLAILDLNLPGEDGLSLASRLRETHPELGIIMLTARVQSEDRAAGYAKGADIYLTKPASLAELEHAISALSRRLHPRQTASQRSALQLDAVHRTLVYPEGRIVALTGHECELITAFTRAAQGILETWQIASILGMDSEHINKPAIELHIVRLRKKLPQRTDDRSPIVALRGRGYRLCVPILLIG